MRYCAQARAVENQCYVVMAGNVGNLPKVDNMDIQYSQSCVLTPCDFPFARDGIAADTTPNVEMVAIADLPLDSLRARAPGRHRAEPEGSPLRSLFGDVARKLIGAESLSVISARRKASFWSAGGSMLKTLSVIATMAVIADDADKFDNAAIAEQRMHALVVAVADALLLEQFLR